MQDFWLVLLVVLVSIGIAGFSWGVASRMGAGRAAGREGAAQAERERVSPDRAGPERAEPRETTRDLGRDTSGGTVDTAQCARRSAEQRCAQAVHRASEAVQAVTSRPARAELSAVVRRMEAELPDVRAVVALGQELGGGAADAAVTRRVDEQLADAARGFDGFTQSLLVLIAELPGKPELTRLGTDTARLRQRFPLLRPLSTITGVRHPTGPELGPAQVEAAEQVAGREPESVRAG